MLGSAFRRRWLKKRTESSHFSLTLAMFVICLSKGLLGFNFLSRKVFIYFGSRLGVWLGCFICGKGKGRRVGVGEEVVFTTEILRESNDVRTLTG